MKNKELKKLLEKLNKWKEKQSAIVRELNDIIIEIESFDPAGDDEEGSNPPGGPGTPP